MLRPNLKFESNVNLLLTDKMSAQNFSTARRLDGSTARRLDGSTARRLDGSTARRLDGSISDFGLRRHNAAFLALQKIPSPDGTPKLRHEEPAFRPATSNDSRIVRPRNREPQTALIYDRRTRWHPKRVSNCLPGYAAARNDSRNAFPNAPAARTGLKSDNQTPGRVKKAAN